MRNKTKIAVVVGTLFCLASCSIWHVTNHLKEQQVLIFTNYGNITLKLYNETPLHRNNFIRLIKKRQYDGVLFHRVIKSFMIQGGDPDSKTATPTDTLGNGDVGYSIAAEFRTPQIYHKYGVLAAAREGDNVNPKKVSSGCQFYIVVGKTFNDEQLDTMQKKKIAKYGHANDSTYMFSAAARHDYKTIGGTPHLDGNYTVFGEVIHGMDVVERISAVETNELDRPIKDVRIIKMILI